MGKDLTKVSQTVFICNGSSCLKKGADENTLALREAIKEHQIHDQTHTVRTKCTGQCDTGPIVFIHPEGIWYKNVTEAISEQIVSRHLIQNEPLNGYILFKEGDSIMQNNSND